MFHEPTRLSCIFAIDACELVVEGTGIESSGYTVVALDGQHDRRADLILTKQGGEWLVPIGSK